MFFVVCSYQYLYVFSCIFFVCLKYGLFLLFLPLWFHVVFVLGLMVFVLLVDISAKQWWIVDGQIRQNMVKTTDFIVSGNHCANTFKLLYGYQTIQTAAGQPLPCFKIPTEGKPSTADYITINMFHQESKS